VIYPIVRREIFFYRSRMSIPSSVIFAIPTLVKNVFNNGRLYTQIRGTLGNPRGVVVVGKKFISGRDERKLGEMKRLRDKISCHRQGLTYSLRHVVRAFSRRSRREAEVSRHTERALLSVSCAVSRSGDFRRFTISRAKNNRVQCNLKCRDL